MKSDGDNFIYLKVLIKIVIFLMKKIIFVFCLIFVFSFLMGCSENSKTGESGNPIDTSEDNFGDDYEVNEKVYSFSGTVISNDGTPIQDARINLNYEYAITDSEGKFKINDIGYLIEDEDLEITIEKEGFEKFVKKLNSQEVFAKENYESSFTLQPSFVDCGTVNVGKVDDGVELLEKAPCFSERILDCKQTKITIESTSLMGDDVTSYEIISGDENNCKIIQKNEKGLIPDKEATCNIDTKTYKKFFPSISTFLYKCDGSLVDPLKKLYKLILAKDFQFAVPSGFAYQDNTSKGNYVVISSNEKEVFLAIFDKIGVYTDIETINSKSLEKAGDKFKGCEEINSLGWQFDGTSIYKCLMSSDSGDPFLLYYLNKNGKELSVMVGQVSKPVKTEIPEEKIKMYENYMKKNIWFN